MALPHVSSSCNAERASPNRGNILSITVNYKTLIGCLRYFGKVHNSTSVNSIPPKTKVVSKIPAYSMRYFNTRIQHDHASFLENLRIIYSPIRIK